MLKPGYRGGDKLKPPCQPGGDKLKPPAVMNSSFRTALSGTHTVLNRSPSVLLLSRTRVAGLVLFRHSVARSSASSSDGASAPVTAPLSVPSARSAPVRLPPIAPLR